MAEERNIKDMEVNSKELSLILGLSVRRIQQMVQDGILDPMEQGVFVLTDAVQQYLKFICKNLPNEEDTKLERARKKAEAQLKASKATVAKLEAEELRGNMHRSDDVAAFTEDLIYTIRASLLALPGRLSVDVASVDTPAEASEIVRREVYKIMRELANYKYDPLKYEERVRQRMEWSERDGDDDG